MKSRSRFGHSTRVLLPPISKRHKQRVSHSVDVDRLLHFSQQLYAHALTLQAVIRNEGGVTYEVLRPKYDRQAAEQFKIFHHTLGRRHNART